MTYDFSRFREQNVARWSAQTFSRALGNYQKCRRFPTSRKGQTRHHHEIKEIAERGNGPVGLGAISQPAGEIAQASRNHFPKTCNDADLGRTGPEVFQERPNDTMSALVSHVCE